MEVLCTSPWIPAEWVIAHGLAPRGAWSGPMEGGSAVLGGVCPYVQSMLDLCSRNRALAVIFTTACDQMRRAFDSLVERRDRNAFLFNLPATWQSPAARVLYRGEIERLGNFLLRLGGQLPSRARLEHVMKRFDQERGRLRRAIADRPGRAAAEALGAFFQNSALPEDWGQNKVAGVTSFCRASSKQAVPLAVLGGPIMPAEWSLFDALEAVGGCVVLNGLEPGERCLLPSLPEFNGSHDLLGLLAGHYFDNIVDVFRRPNSQLYSWLARCRGERGFRGIVLWVRVGCDLWRAEAASLREAFELPVLVLEAPAVHGSESGAVLGPRELTRIAAFLESLK